MVTTSSAGDSTRSQGIHLNPARPMFRPHPSCGDLGRRAAFWSRHCPWTVVVDGSGSLFGLSPTKDQLIELDANYVSQSVRSVAPNSRIVSSLAEVGVVTANPLTGVWSYDATSGLTQVASFDHLAGAAQGDLMFVSETGASRTTLGQDLGRFWPMSLNGSAGAQRVAPVPTMSGPSSVVRAMTGDFRLAEVLASHVLSWTFNAKLQAPETDKLIIRPIPSATSWTGGMAASGTVVSRVLDGSTTRELRRRVKVLPRPRWTFPAVEAQKFTNGTGPFVGGNFIPEPPSPQRAALSLLTPQIAQGWQATVLPDGPSQELAYWINVQDATTYKWSVSNSIEDLSSEFSRAQCGTLGVISGAKLRANAWQHEAGATGESHWRYYKLANDLPTNNVKILLEATVGVGSSDLGERSNVVSVAAHQRIVAAAKVEPCGGTIEKDGANGCFQDGYVNVPPYQLCPQP